MEGESQNSEDAGRQAVIDRFGSTCPGVGDLYDEMVSYARTLPRAVVESYIEGDLEPLSIVVEQDFGTEHATVQWIMIDDIMRTMYRVI